MISLDPSPPEGEAAQDDRRLKYIALLINIGKIALNNCKT
jgi:hypothetical protein